MSQHTIRTLEQLQALYAPVSEASIRKEVDHVHPLYRALIEASPFAVLATSGPGGLFERERQSIRVAASTSSPGLRGLIRESALPGVTGGEWHCLRLPGVK